KAKYSTTEQLCYAQRSTKHTPQLRNACPTSRPPPGMAPLFAASLRLPRKSPLVNSARRPTHPAGAVGRAFKGTPNPSARRAGRRRSRIDRAIYLRFQAFRGLPMSRPGEGSVLGNKRLRAVESVMKADEKGAGFQ